MPSGAAGKPFNDSIFLDMPSGAVLGYAIYSFYFQALPGLGSSDRRHFYFCFLWHKITVLA